VIKFKIKRDDVVVVVSGKHKGERGRVLRLEPEQSLVVVEQVNMVTRHVKPRGDQPGGAVEKEAAIHISNVALWNSQTEKPMKVGWKRLDDGRKVRYDKATQAVID
jgi:large subunit ribosomal protein L24